jgi:hypothetical protein
MAESSIFNVLAQLVPGSVERRTEKRDKRDRTKRKFLMERKLFSPARCKTVYFVDAGNFEQTIA